VPRLAGIRGRRRELAAVSCGMSAGWRVAAIENRRGSVRDADRSLSSGPAIAGVLGQGRSRSREPFLRGSPLGLLVLTAASRPGFSVGAGHRTCPGSRTRLVTAGRCLFSKHATAVMRPQLMFAQATQFSEALRSGDPLQRATQAPGRPTGSSIPVWVVQGLLRAGVQEEEEEIRQLDAAEAQRRLEDFWSQPSDPR
jgi:hypothetical protein